MEGEWSVLLDGCLGDGIGDGRGGEIFVIRIGCVN